MTIADGEIIGLTVVVVVLAVGTVVICFRCWKAISRANKEEQAAKLRHRPERGFYVSGYVETIRQGFRSWSFRSKEPPPKVTIPRVHVATVQDLINERSDLHPVYKEHKEGLPPSQEQQDRSPEEGQGDYHRLAEESVETGSVHGIENPMYGEMNGDIQPPTQLYNTEETLRHAEVPSDVNIDCDHASRSNDQSSGSSDQGTKSSEDSRSDDRDPRSDDQDKDTCININNEAVSLATKPNPCTDATDCSSVGCGEDVKATNNCVFSAFYKQGDVNFMHTDRGHINSDSYI